METKQSIRQRIIAQRETGDVLYWQDATDIITKQIIEHDWFRESTDIYCYVSYRGEVGTRQIVEEAWRLGKQVWAPKVEGDALSFYPLTSYAELQEGKFNLSEPTEGETADGEEGLVIVPGVAFDKHRNRIGFGKGYYDRYLAAHPNLHTIAVSFDMQIVDEVPWEESDIRPEVLITETQAYTGEDEI